MYKMQHIRHYLLDEFQKWNNATNAFRKFWEVYTDSVIPWHLWLKRVEKGDCEISDKRRCIRRPDMNEKNFWKRPLIHDNPPEIELETQCVMLNCRRTSQANCENLQRWNLGFSVGFVWGPHTASLHLKQSFNKKCQPFIALHFYRWWYGFRIISSKRKKAQQQWDNNAKSK